MADDDGDRTRPAYSGRCRQRPVRIASPPAHAPARRCWRCKARCPGTQTSNNRYAPTPMASVCTPPCAAAPTTARRWSSYAATSRAQPWPTSACKPTPRIGGAQAEDRFARRHNPPRHVAAGFMQRLAALVPRPRLHSCQPLQGTSAVRSFCSWPTSGPTDTGFARRVRAIVPAHRSLERGGPSPRNSCRKRIGLALGLELDLLVPVGDPDADGRSGPRVQLWLEPLSGGDSPSSTGRNRSAAEPRDLISVPLNCLSCWLATLLSTMQIGFEPWEAAGGAKQGFTQVPSRAADVQVGYLATREPCNSNWHIRPT